MAIELLENPGTSAPTVDTDYTKQNTLISAGHVPVASLFADWLGTTTEPSLALGGFVKYEGNLYQVKDEDESISGTISSGLNYISMELSGTELLASWVQDISDYTFDPAYGAMYSSDTIRKVLLSDLCYYDGSSAYYRGRGQGQDINPIVFGDGSFFVADSMKLGFSREADGSISIDLIGDTTYTEYGLRIIRNSGENGTTQIIHRGTGNLILSCSDGGAIAMGSSFLPPPSSATTNGSESISAGGSWTIPRGIYTIYEVDNDDHYLQVLIDGTWQRMNSTNSSGNYAMQIISDGANYRVYSVTAYSVDYLKH
jgi:hypothetical protein